MKRHNWKRQTIFEFICIKCGCRKTNTAARYPCITEYKIDGKTHIEAPECDERNIWKVVPSEKQGVLFP